MCIMRRYTHSMDNRSVAEIKAALAASAPASLPAFVAAHEHDPRAGVQELIVIAGRRFERYEREQGRLRSLAAEECRLMDAGVLAVAGVDEVGRGALAGPVSAGACVFDRDVHIEGLDDSKVLSRQARERLHGQILSCARAVAVGHADSLEIDRIGIASATALAMRRALEALCLPIDHVLVDGRMVDLGRPITAIVRGDARVRAIAAAAVYAKVTRDALMCDLDARYPGYGLAENKGYGSAEHLAALAELGPSPVHRRSFGPCSQLGLF